MTDNKSSTEDTKPESRSNTGSGANNDDENDTQKNAPGGSRKGSKTEANDKDKDDQEPSDQGTAEGATSSGGETKNDDQEPSDQGTGGGTTASGSDTKNDDQEPSDQGTGGGATGSGGDTKNDDQEQSDQGTSGGATGSGGDTKNDDQEQSDQGTSGGATGSGGDTKNNDQEPSDQGTGGGATGSADNTKDDAPPTTSPVASGGTANVKEDDSKEDAPLTSSNENVEPLSTQGTSGTTGIVDKNDSSDNDGKTSANDSNEPPAYVNQLDSIDTEKEVPNQSPGSNLNTEDELGSSVEPKTNLAQNTPPVVHEESNTNSNTSGEASPVKSIETLVATKVSPTLTEEHSPVLSALPKSNVIQNTSPLVNEENNTTSNTNFGATSEPGLDTVINQDREEDLNEHTTLLPAEENLDKIKVSPEGPLASPPPTSIKSPKESITGSQGFKVIALVAGIVVIASLIQVIIGSLYKNNCPVNPFIPIYLIVAGILGILLPVFLVFLRTVARKHKENPDIGYFFEYALFLIYLGWLLVGCVWVFGVNATVQFVNSANTDTYCLSTLYYCASATIIITAIFMVIFLIISYRTKTSKNAGSTSKKSSA